VVPCYNEARRLDVTALGRYAASGSAHRFLFVNDGSTDGTLRLLESLRDSDAARFGVLSLPKNSGKAEAVRQGILAASADRGDYLGYWDADLATPLSAIKQFCGVLDERPDLELVMGARVKLLGRFIHRKGARHYLGRLFATAVSLVLGIGVYDTQCGAKLFRASGPMRALFDEPFISSWIFDVEILARLIRDRRNAGLPAAETVIYEFPLDEWRDVSGSKLRPHDFARSALELAAIYRRYLR